jgi:hypothetical protein
MPSGRKPDGDASLSNAERQARYHLHHQEGQTPGVVESHWPVDRRSRQQRSHDAMAELLTLQAACAAWLEAVPDALRGTATAEALQAIVDLDLETLAAIELPRGYGRDCPTPRPGRSHGNLIMLGSDDGLKGCA